MAGSWYEITLRLAFILDIVTNAEITKINTSFLTPCSYTYGYIDHFGDSYSTWSGSSLS